MTTRRTLLAALGLAPIGIGTESFVTPAAKGEERMPQVPYGGAANARIAAALRKLAAEIDAGRFDSCSIEVYGSIRFDDIVRHELKISGVYLPEAGA